MADPKDKSLLDKAEDYVSDSYDEQRKQIPPWDDVGRVKHDVEVGIMKGVYGGAKQLISGAIDLLRLTFDPAAQHQFTQKAWPVVVKLAKETYISRFGTPAEIQDQNERSLAFAKEVYAGFEKDWKKAAGTDGKRTELAAKWVSRVGFEVGALAIGAGEAKAAVKGAEIAGDLEKLEEGAAILEEVTQPCIKLTDEEILAEQAAKEAEAASKAKTVEMPAAKDPSTAKTVEMPAVEDPSAAKTVETPAVERPSVEVTQKVKIPMGHETPEKAAVAAMQEANPKSVAENLEYGGWVKEHPDGTFGYHPPTRGTVDGMQNMPKKGPDDVCWWHCHGAEDARFKSEEFSGGDRRYSARNDAPGYVATPKGKIMKYDPATGAEVVLPDKAPP